MFNSKYIGQYLVLYYTICTWHKLHVHVSVHIFSYIIFIYVKAITIKSVNIVKYVKISSKYIINIQKLIIKRLL